MFIGLLTLTFFHLLNSQQDLCFTCDCRYKQQEIDCTSKSINPFNYPMGENAIFSILRFQRCKIDRINENFLKKFKILTYLDVRNSLVSFECASLNFSRNFTIEHDCIFSTTITTSRVTTHTQTIHSSRTTFKISPSTIQPVSPTTNPLKTDSSSFFSSQETTISQTTTESNLDKKK